MPKIFESATKNLAPNERHFDEVVARGEENDTDPILHDNSFGGITFDTFFGYEIRQIGSNAFNNSVDKIKYFFCTSCSLDIKSLKNVFNQMNQLEVLEIVTKAGEIPSNVITPVGNQTKLKRVAITEENDSLIIRSGAFQHLNQLQVIEFFYTSIQTIEEEAFKLDSTSNSSSVKIGFYWSHLTSETFKNGSFDGITKPIQVTFMGTSINYLAEGVFKTVLSNKNGRINLSGSSFLDCSDCRNYWLVKDYNQTHVQHTKCKNSPSNSSLFTQESKTKLSQKCKLTRL